MKVASRRLVHLCAAGIPLTISLTLSSADAQPPNAWLSQDFAVPVVHVEGNQIEMATQLGQLTAQLPGHNEFMDAFAGEVNKTINSSSILKKIPFLRTIAKWIYHFSVRDPLVDALPKMDRKAYEAFAKGMGYDKGKMLDGMILSDSSLAIQEFMQGIDAIPKVKTIACSSIFWDSSDGKTTYFARNLDSENIGLWDKHLILVHAVPKNGLASISVQETGFPAGGITAFNETGLTLALHQLNESGTDKNGVTVLAIGDHIMREAHTIDEAIAIVQKFKRAGTWAYVLSQHGEKAVIETTSKDFFVRRSRDSFYYVGSHPQGPDLKRDEAFFYAGDMLDSLERIDRMEHYGRAFAASHEASPSLIGELISDRPKVAGGTVSRLDNVHSAVIDAEHGRIWLGLGDDDKVAPSQGRYVGFQWNDLRSSDKPLAIDGFTPAQHTSTMSATLRGILRQVQVADTMGDDEKLNGLLYQYTQMVTQSPTLEVGAGLGLYLYVWERLIAASVPQDQIQGLVDLVNFAMSDSDLNQPTRWSQYRRSVGQLTMAWLHDLMGDRTQALADYNALLAGTLEPRVKDAATKGLKHQFSKDDAKGIDLSASMIDLIL